MTEFPGLGSVHGPTKKLWNTRYRDQLDQHDLAALTQLYQDNGSVDFDPIRHPQLIRQNLISEEAGVWRCNDRGALCLMRRGIIHTG